MSSVPKAERARSSDRPTPSRGPRTAPAKPPKSPAKAATPKASKEKEREGQPQPRSTSGVKKTKSAHAMVAPVTAGGAFGGALLSGTASALSQAFRPFFGASPEVVPGHSAQAETRQDNRRAIRAEGAGPGSSGPDDVNPEGSPLGPPSQEQVREAQQFYFQFKGKRGLERFADKAREEFRNVLKAYLDNEIPLYERDIKQAKTTRQADELSFELSRLRLSYRAYFGESFPDFSEEELSKLKNAYQRLVQEGARNERVDRARVRWMDARWLHLHSQIRARREKLENVGDLPGPHQGIAVLDHEAAIDRLNNELEELGGVFEKYGLLPIYVD